MSKLPKSAHRQFNVATIDEFARISHSFGIDIWDGIRDGEIAPYGLCACRPCSDVAGCRIPIDADSLGCLARTELGESFRCVELEQAKNATMPNCPVQRVEGLLAEKSVALKGATTLNSGFSYERDISNLHKRAAMPVMCELTKLRGTVNDHDPYLVNTVLGGSTVLCRTDLATGAHNADCVQVPQYPFDYRGQEELFELDGFSVREAWSRSSMNRRWVNRNGQDGDFSNVRSCAAKSQHPTCAAREPCIKS